MSDKLFSWSVVADKTDVSIPFALETTAGAAVTGKVASDLTISYWRQGGTRTAISASDLAALNSTHSDGGVKEADSTNMASLYRLDLPDAAVANGADWVVIVVKCSGARDYRVWLPIQSAGTVENAANLATLLSRIVGTLASGTHNAQSGDAYARLGAPAGASVSADIDALPTANENADALLDRTSGIETSFTLRQALRLILAMAAGKVSISGATVTIRDVNDSKNRIVATTDADGQRTDVTKDVS